MCWKASQEYCTADYGTREPSYSTHHGMDFINDAGHACNAIAVADGEVVAMQDFVDGFSDTYTAGNYVRIKHESGVYSRYLHLVKGSVKVKVGQKVKAGAVLVARKAIQVTLTERTCTLMCLTVRSMLDSLPYLMGEKSFYKAKKPHKHNCYSRKQGQGKGRSNIFGRCKAFCGSLQHCL